MVCLVLTQDQTWKSGASLNSKIELCISAQSCLSICMKNKLGNPARAVLEYSIMLRKL
jgi:hypothetical protein